MPISTSNARLIHTGLELRLQLRKIQENHRVRAKAKDILRLALGRTLIEDTDRRHARVAESDIIFFRFIFFQLFEVKADLDWDDKAIQFSPDGWRHTWHKEIRGRTGLSKDELRRKITRFTTLGLIETGHRQKEDSLKLDGLYLLGLNACDLEFQAQVLLRKRFEAVSSLIPQTCSNLGADAWALFAQHARASFPAGDYVAIQDARHFLECLQQKHSSAISRSENNRVRFARASSRLSVHFVSGVPVRDRPRRCLQFFIRKNPARWKEYVVYFAF